MRLFITCLIFAISSSCFGQELHNGIEKVFNFYPHKLTSEEQKALYPKLDNFFDLVIKDKEKYLEPLRTELRSEGNNPYFYFDGGVLLLEISRDPKDIQLAADALVKSDLKDLPGDMYLQLLLSLSLKGADIIDPALHILDDTTFNAFIPQHVLTLKYGEGLKFLLPRYKPDLYVGKLISKYEQIRAPDKKLTCIDLFVYANSCQADEFLETQLQDSQQPRIVQEKISETIKIAKVSRSENGNKYSKLFDERKRILSRISDEAIYELNNVTLKMRKTFKCN
ncbi:hypothetical protein [Rufibacter tibetensis]|uniref:Uncharacterized protein n=1 Tax=Rufibacter tibetensis TaxID=512763 RepID=A0A0P0CJK2_9BACT|nr:hypothetical protein [Rufibacter tibetensis]ALI99613.1 hypothetical protein DC20_12320 [Rufibacter tibetensis]